MFNRFKDKMQEFFVFSVRDILNYFPNFDKKNLVYWQKTGTILKIRNNYYCFADIDKNEYLLFLIANEINSPSYISFESALSFHNIIPEGVYSIISATTLKTNTFSTQVGNFNYHHLKPELFFGYTLISIKNRKFKIAGVEKTILDYLYLNHTISSSEDFISLRWNKEILKQIDLELFKNYRLLFNSNALNQRVVYFLNFINA